MITTHKSFKIHSNPKLSFSHPSLSTIALISLSSTRPKGITKDIENQEKYIMKQKVVIKVSLSDKKSRTKAIKTAVGVDGVVQAALQQEKNHLEVTGDGIDVVLLATLLRKSLKHAEVVSVSAVEDKKPPAKPAEPPMQSVWPIAPPISYYYQGPMAAEPAYAYDNSQSGCSIM